MSAAPHTLPPVIGFGAFEVDLRSGELRRDGVRIPLQEQPFRVLARLLQHPGELVTRDELRRELWPDNTFLDFEHGVNAAIKRLRDALGDSADNPAFIETLPRRGYRFIAPVQTHATTSIAPDAPASPTLTPPRGRIVAAGVVLLIALVAGAIWIFRTTTPESSPPLQAEETAPAAPAGLHGRHVTVSIFQNRTADPAFEALGPQIAGRLIRALAPVTGVEVAPDALDTAAGLGTAGGRSAPHARIPDAGLLVSGEIFRHGDRLELQSRIVDVASGRLLHALPPFTAARTDPNMATELLEQHVAGAVAIHFDEFFGGLDFVSHPPPIDAYREYRAGLEIFRADYPRAIAHLQRALEIAPRFSVARVVMLFAHGNVGEKEKAAAELSRLEHQRNQLTPAERLFVDFLREDREGRSAEALRVLQDLEVLTPRSLLVNHNIIHQSVFLNRPRTAVAAYDRLASDVRTLRYSIGTWRMNLVTRSLHLLGEYERELAESRRGQRYAPGMLAFVGSEVRALAALGRLEELHAVIERSLAIQATSGVVGAVLEEAALALRAHGYREAALALANRAVDWQRAQPAGTTSREARYFTGTALYHAERWEEAEEMFLGLDTEEERLPNREWEHPVVLLGWMGLSAARRGDIARARDFSAELQRFTDRDLNGRHSYWRARIAAVLGERERAVDLLRESLAQGQPVGLALHHAFDFAALRDYPPFQELVRPQD